MVAAIATFCVRYVIVGLMLSIGLEARVDDLRQIARQRAMYLRALFVVEIAVPLIAIAVTTIVPVPRLGKELILLMAVCPGAPFIPFVTRTKGESYSPFGLNILVLTSVLAPVTVPVWIWLLRHSYGFDLGITPMQVFGTVAPSILLPLAIGLIVSRGLPRFAHVLKPIALAIVLAGLVIAIGVALYKGAPTLLKMAKPTLIAVFFVVGGAALLGAAAVRDQPSARRAAADCAVLGNPALALAIVGVSYPGLRAMPFVAAYIIARRICLVPFELWLTRGRPSKQNRRPGWPGRRLSPST